MAETVARTLRAAAARLSSVTESARLEAEWLMAYALGCSRSDLLLRHMLDAAPEGFGTLVDRRVGGEPLAHVTGETEFRGLVLKVTPDVLVPRSDTEQLIDVAEGLLTSRAPHRILDCGVGSGALLLAALDLWSVAHGIGIECSAEALAVAQENALHCGLENRAEMRAGDWTQPGWAADLGQFDLVLSNPPYIAEDDPDLAADVESSDPHGALFAGKDGLDDYRILVPALCGLLKPGGLAVFEIGFRQAEAVIGLAHAAGLRAEAHDDLAGRPRAIAMWHESGHYG